jgi:phage-related minor tail protein
MVVLTQNKQHKKLKGLTQEMIEHEAKVKKWLVRFDFQIGDLEREVNIVRESEKKEGRVVDM